MKVLANMCGPVWEPLETENRPLATMWGKGLTAKATQCTLQTSRLSDPLCRLISHLMNTSDILLHLGQHFLLWVLHLETSGVHNRL